MEGVWIPSVEELTTMCKLCKSSDIQSLKLWIDRTRQSRPVCRGTFYPDDAGSKPVPLILAAYYNNVQIVKYLLTDFSSVIDVNDTGGLKRNTFSRAVRGVTPLWAACWRLHKEESLEVIHLLLRAGADVNAASTSDNSSPMQIAAYLGDCRLMKLLYDHGAGLDMTGPLMVAAFRGRSNAVAFLLRSGFELNQKAPNGCTVFHAAVYGNCNGRIKENVIQTLISNGSYPSFELTRPDSFPCPLLLAVHFKIFEIVERLMDLPNCTQECRSEAYLLMGTVHGYALLDQSIPDHWTTALKLRDGCGYTPKFLPSSDVYAGLSEIATLEDLSGPPKDWKSDVATWVMYQSVMMRERILGPAFMHRILVNAGFAMCRQKMYKHAELLWLHSIECYTPTDVLCFQKGTAMKNGMRSVCVYAKGIHDMVELHYQPEFSKFVLYAFRHLTELLKPHCQVMEVELLRILKSLLWIFTSWIRSGHGKDGKMCSDECEELGKQFVAKCPQIPGATTLLHLALSNFSIRYPDFLGRHNFVVTEAHRLFGSYYQPLIFALLRWGCDEMIYSLNADGLYPIHVAVRAGNQCDVDLVTPLLRYGCSPLVVDLKGQTPLHLAMSQITVCALREAPASLFSLCSVTIIHCGLAHEILNLPSHVKEMMRRFDKGFAKQFAAQHRLHYDLWGFPDNL